MKLAILSAIAAGLWPIAAAAPAPSAAAKDATSPVSVAISSGTIVGTAGDTVDTFNGIPFADPPIGDLRFRPPVRLSRDLGTFDATGVAASCHPGPVLNPKYLVPPPDAVTGVLHSPNITEGIIAAALLDSSAGETPQSPSEDCLTVSVQRPRGVEAGAGLPVLFWIYGGGFVAGSTSGFNGTKLIDTGVMNNQPFIFVAVNYRVGAWGFMPGREILEEGSGNAGLLDQRMGLEWVADNIEAFGGDPRKVTVWGESSGAISTFEQLVLYDGDAKYKGHDLFRAAIMNSGSITPVDPLDTKKGQDVYDAVKIAAGCDVEDSLACLRGLDNDVFSDAANSLPGIISYQSLALSYLPRPDGTVLTDSPDVLAKAGKFHHVPMILGNQEDEGTLFSIFQQNMGSTDRIVKYLSRYYLHNASKEQITDFVNTYSEKAADGSPYRTFLAFQFYPGKKRITSILGDIVFDLIRRVTMQIFQDVSPELKTWAYFSSYNYDPILGAFGTAHGSDVNVLFNLENTNYPTLSGRTYYINFLHNLDPNVGTQSDLFWPQWAEGHQLLHFNAKSNGIKEDDYRNSSYSFMFDHIESLRF
ncbi:Alpha/Beta hydrolase protein [Trichoderma austrokoningii]